jgi:hypothetical protein
MNLLFAGGEGWWSEVCVCASNSFEQLVALPPPDLKTFAVFPPSFLALPCDGWPLISHTHPSPTHPQVKARFKSCSTSVGQPESRT